MQVHRRDAKYAEEMQVKSHHRATESEERMEESVFVRSGDDDRTKDALPPGGVSKDTLASVCSPHSMKSTAGLLLPAEGREVFWRIVACLRQGSGGQAVSGTNVAEGHTSCAGPPKFYRRRVSRFSRNSSPRPLRLCGEKGSEYSLCPQCRCGETIFNYNALLTTN